MRQWVSFTEDELLSQYSEKFCEKKKQQKTWAVILAVKKLKKLRARLHWFSCILQTLPAVLGRIAQHRLGDIGVPALRADKESKTPSGDMALALSQCIWPKAQCSPTRSGQDTSSRTGCLDLSSQCLGLQGEQWREKSNCSWNPCMRWTGRKTGKDWVTIWGALKRINVISDLVTINSHPGLWYCDL